MRQAAVVGRGVFETRGVLTAEARLRDVDPALLPWWRLPEHTPHGLLSGRASIRARKSRPYLTGEIAMDLDPGRLGRLLIERGALPIVFMAHLTGGNGGMAPAVTAEELSAETKIDEATAEDLEGFGTGFMEDD